jgi:uncharacterized protein YutE (UPF0331/DUF86 family)
MAGLRNILVHDYLFEIDRRLVYRALKDRLVDCEQFTKAVSRLL